MKGPDSRLACNFSASIILLCLLLGGCGGAGNRAPTVELRIRGVTLTAEVAATTERRQLGLMFRRKVPEGSGMLFIFPRVDYQAFHMTNTPTPLSLAYISEEGKILQIAPLKPFDGSQVPSAHRVPYALEVPRGWFQKHGIGEGEVVEGLEEVKKAFPPS